MNSILLGSQTTRFFETVFLCEHIKLLFLITLFCDVHAFGIIPAMISLIILLLSDILGKTNWRSAENRGSVYFGLIFTA